MSPRPNKSVNLPFLVALTSYSTLNYQTNLVIWCRTLLLGEKKLGFNTHVFQFAASLRSNALNHPHKKSHPWSTTSTKTVHWSPWRCKCFTNKCCVASYGYHTSACWNVTFVHGEPSKKKCCGHIIVFTLIPITAITKFWMINVGLLPQEGIRPRIIYIIPTATLRMPLCARHQPMPFSLGVPLDASYTASLHQMLCKSPR